MFGRLPKLPGVPTMNCNNTIAATLDLAQAVETFKQTIAKELLVDAVSRRGWENSSCSRTENQTSSIDTSGTMYRLVVTQAVRVEGSTYNCGKTNTGMAASKKQGKWASRTAGAMFG